MSGLTVDDWLKLAPCPPQWNPGLLYRTPYPVNLTEEEVQKIAQRCGVPPKNELIMSSSVQNTLIVLVSLSVTLLGFLIAVFVYRYKHKKHMAGDSCLQPMGSKHDLLDDKDRGNKGYDNNTYIELRSDTQYSDKTSTKHDLSNSENTITQPELQISDDSFPKLDLLNSDNIKTNKDLENARKPKMAK